ncbi:MAG: Outer membrane protein assembly factor BamE precursor [Candidatus Accumulibacter cognatus]|uniref:Outer membrane protein assembly factor BamE n=3 Tax=Candidatus Accumulibacter TaxID=327159 RepID=A0A080MB32_9PROT|nr:MAG: Outer membrane protein assembly factor BamE precursor [Candidatus Accumulibacter cognatus]
MIYPAMAAVRHCRKAFRRIPHDPTSGAAVSLAIARIDHSPRSDLNMIFTRLAIPVTVLCTLAACSTVPRIVNEYRIDVQQGNVLSQEMVSQLRPGLTKDQVRFILGTPVLTDMFHANRWDYFYWLKKGNSGEVETRRFTVFFDADGKLRSVAGDVAPVQSTDTAAVFEVRNREIDLGSLPADSSTEQPPPDGPGFFGTIMESMGF